MMVAFGILLMLFMSAAACEADIYKTVDENGVVCYTDVSFSKADVKIMKTPEAPVRQKEVVKGEPGKREFHGIVKEKAAKYEMDPSLIHAVIKAESNGNPYAVSKKGAKGLMQLMPTTANDLQVRNAFDPEENIDGGTRYLKHLIERFNGDLTLALAAYNAGPKTVEKTGSVPRIPETKDYVRKVLSLYGGKAYYPILASSQAPSPKEKTEAIYKVQTEDGGVLFTNLPQNRKYPRF